MSDGAWLLIFALAALAFLALAGMTFFDKDDL